jgi:hypothetical protein
MATEPDNKRRVLQIATSEGVPKKSFTQIAKDVAQEVARKTASNPRLEGSEIPTGDPPATPNNVAPETAQNPQTPKQGGGGGGGNSGNNQVPETPNYGNWAKFILSALGLLIMSIAAVMSSHYSHVEKMKTLDVAEKSKDPVTLIQALNQTSSPREYVPIQSSSPFTSQKQSESVGSAAMQQTPAAQSRDRVEQSSSTVSNSCLDVKKLSSGGSCIVSNPSDVVFSPSANAEWEYSTSCGSIRMAFAYGSSQLEYRNGMYQVRQGCPEVTITVTNGTLGFSN